MIIGPHCDISLLAKTGDWAPVLEFNHLTRILLTVECGTEEGVHRLELHQKSGQVCLFVCFFTFSVKQNKYSVQYMKIEAPLFFTQNIINMVYKHF